MGDETAIRVGMGMAMACDCCKRKLWDIMGLCPLCSFCWKKIGNFFFSFGLSFFSFQKWTLQPAVADPIKCDNGLIFDEMK